MSRLVSSVFQDLLKRSDPIIDGKHPKAEGPAIADHRRSTTRTAGFSRSSATIGLGIGSTKMILGARPDGALRITFVECGYQRFVEDFLLSNGPSYKLYEVKSWRDGWQEFCTPGTTEKEKEVVCAFNADWTVYVDNSANCTAKNIYYAMPHRLHTRGVSFFTMLPRATVKFKAFSMDYVDGTRSSEEVLLRSVGVYQEDSSWVFQDHGNPLPFEDVSRYRARRKTDRIDHALLCQYAAALGLELEIERELHPVGVITWVPGGHEPVSKAESARSFVSQFIPGKFRVITKRNLSDEVQQ